VAPFHPLRHDARVAAARVLASIATFLAIALVLLGGSTNGPLASAEADQGAPSVAPVGQTEPVAVPTEPAAVPTEPAVPAEAPAPEPAPAVPAVPATPASPPATPASPPATAGPEPSSQSAKPPVQDPVQGVDPPPSETPHGGGSKEEPTDPVQPETPPTAPNPAHPAPDPGRAPSGKGGVWPPGKPGSDEPGGGPAPSGAGKRDVEDAVVTEPRPAGAPGGGEQLSTPPSGEATIPPTTPSAPGTPSDESLGERGSTPGEPERINAGATGRNVGGGNGAGDGGGGTGTGTAAAPGATLGASAPVDVAAVLADVAGADDAGDAAPEDELVADTGGLEPQPLGRVFGSLPDLLPFVPDSIKIALAALAALSILLGFAYLLSALRNRRLERQRGELLKEVGLLQTALLPPVPERVGALRTSVAYRPADGPGAGGDFYDVLPLAGGRVGFILGDVSGHGRGALARTAFMRYTLRAYLEAGLEPRVALQVAGRVIDENLGGDFATVLLAVHDPETGSLTYASAGHPAPIVVGPQAHDPVTAGSSPPIGVGVRTGLRQTTVPLVPGAVAALFTDGLMEARVNGGILGRERLETLLGDLGPDVTAAALIASVREEARTLSDDIAAVIIQPTGGATAGLFRTEQLELTARELDGPIAGRFLESCGIPKVEADAAISDARGLAERFGGVILHVVFGNRLRVEVLPRNVESIEAASRRAAATR
jgi:hypothetical protein